MTLEDYNQCVIDYSKGVYRFVFKQINDSEKAKDIVQESFLRLWQKRKDVDVEKVKAYLFNTAYHTMIDDIRKNKYLDDQTKILDKGYQSQNPDVKDIINKALDTLPQIQKSVLLLRDGQGYSYNEIGEILNLSQQQVKVYIYRARVSIKEYIKDINNII